eukprot:gene8884-1235_t
MGDVMSPCSEDDVSNGRKTPITKHDTAEKTWLSGNSSNKPFSTPSRRDVRRKTRLMSTEMEGDDQFDEFQKIISTNKTSICQKASNTTSKSTSQPLAVKSSSFVSIRNTEIPTRRSKSFHNCPITTNSLCVRETVTPSTCTPDYFYDNEWTGRNKKLHFQSNYPHVPQNIGSYLNLYSSNDGFGDSFPKSKQSLHLEQAQPDTVSSHCNFSLTYCPVSVNEYCIIPEQQTISCVELPVDANIPQQLNAASYFSSSQIPDFDKLNSGEVQYPLAQKDDFVSSTAQPNQILPNVNTVRFSKESFFSSQIKDSIFNSVFLSEARMPSFPGDSFAVPALFFNKATHQREPLRKYPRAILEDGDADWFEGRDSELVNLLRQHAVSPQHVCNKGLRLFQHGDTSESYRHPGDEQCHYEIRKIFTDKIEHPSMTEHGHDNYLLHYTFRTLMEPRLRDTPV